ncbi:MAG TPA: ribonuclease HII [Caldilineae bacterium]|nr:ribonuclease HII [Caldilineae bacterium]
MPSRLKKELSCWLAGQTVAGLDEAGRGAWAGPVVAAAVILPPESDLLVASLAEVDDSKRLSPATRERLYGRIYETAAAVGVGVIPASEIDRIGILTATYAAMTMALAQLPTRPDHLLIDYIPRPLGAWPQQRIKRGESASLSIAAASIIAKVHRDRLMVEMEAQWPGYGFARHKGYGTAQHRAALDRLGPTPIHRRTWAPLLQLRLPLET